MSKDSLSGTRRTVAQAAMVVGLVAAALVLVMSALLTATHLQLKKADPLNNETLIAMRDRYAAGERTAQVKADIRQLDLLSRKAFFTSQKQVVSGGIVAVVAGGVMLLAFGVYQLATRTIPAPGGESCEGIFWSGVQRSRAWIAGGTVVLVAVSIVMSVSTPTELSDELLAVPDQPEPLAVAPPSTAPVFPDGFAVNAPVFRGAAMTGRTGFEGVPTSWDEDKNENLLWKAPITLLGWASAVVWGEKVFVVGADQEERAIYCLNSDTGDEIWAVQLPEHTGATEGYETDTEDERWDLLMYAAATPAVNGAQVFAMFSNGQLAGVDMETGRVLWHHALGNTKENFFGLSSSLLVYRDSVIVVFEGDERYVARYDAATGREIWKTKRDFPSWAAPVLGSKSDGGHLVVLPAYPNVSAWDPETGKRVWSTEVFTEEIDYCVGPSPVQVGELICVNMQYCGMYGLDLSDGSIAWSLDKLPDSSGFSDGPSMTTDGKHLYQHSQGVLTCVDAGTGKVVKQKETEEYGNYASAVINAGNLYLSSDTVMTVLKADPATDFEQVGKGVMLESCDATPTITGGRIYLRADESLYCFGKK